jgi:hypothetical protein
VGSISFKNLFGNCIYNLGKHILRVSVFILEDIMEFMSNNSLKRLELPLKTPFLTTYAPYSYLTSIIMNQPKAFDWLMNILIQTIGYTVNRKNGESSPELYFITRSSPDSLHYVGNIWDTCPFINKYTMPRQMILLKYNSFTEYLIEMLNNNFYVCVFLDQFFRPNLNAKAPTFAHQNLIYGYDSDKKKFLVADHFNYDRLSFLEIDFNDIETAFKEISNTLKSDEIHREWKREIENVVFVQLRDWDFAFNPRLAAGFLKEYITSKDSTNSIFKLELEGENINKYYYGLGTYELLHIYLQRISSEKITEEWVHFGFNRTDWRPFTFLKDHKSSMKLRIDYLQKNKYLNKSDDLMEEITSLEYELKIIINVFFKHTKTNNIKDLQFIADSLKKLEKNEECMVGKLIERIEG